MDMHCKEILISINELFLGLSKRDLLRDLKISRKFTGNFKYQFNTRIGGFIFTILNY